MKLPQDPTISDTSSRPQTTEPPATGSGAGYAVSTVLTDLSNSIVEVSFIKRPLPAVYETLPDQCKIGSIFHYYPVAKSPEAIREIISESSCWEGEIILITASTALPFNCKISRIHIHEQLLNRFELTLPETDLQHASEAEGLPVNRFSQLLDLMSEGVIVIGNTGTIEQVNPRAAAILGITADSLIGLQVKTDEWKATRSNGSLYEPDEFPILKTLRTGLSYHNEIMSVAKPDGSRIWLSINAQALYARGETIPTAAVAVFTEITDLRNVYDKLEEAELLFTSFMKNSPTLGWVYDENSRLVYGNPLFVQTVGIPEQYQGKKLAELVNKNLSDDFTKLLAYRIRQVVMTGKTIIAEDAVPDLNGQMHYYISYWFPVPLKSRKKLIGGHAIEITDRKLSTTELEKINERIHYAVNASANAIWDMDMNSQTIYRSDSFYQFTGYQKEEVAPTLNWLLQIVHPADRDRLEREVQQSIDQKQTIWQQEYRLKMADGSYRHILDKSFAIIENGEITRVIGGMQDISEIKIAEARQLSDEVQKQKIISQAAIQAQENERNRISGELHDNVNQLLMSAKLHLGVALKQPERADEIMHKASDFILMAVEEIRALTKRLNTSVLMVTGLQKCIQEIVNSMELSRDIKTYCHLNESVIHQLSNEQQLMLYRIVQEQTNNIMKYSGAKEAFITLKEINGNVQLTISDNGCGFDLETHRHKGLGFTNIFNRAHAYNGSAEIVTEPNQGCSLYITIPLKSKAAASEDTTA